MENRVGNDRLPYIFHGDTVATCCRVGCYLLQVLVDTSLYKSATPFQFQLLSFSSRTLPDIFYF